ncbi:MAG: hypothetical protein NVS2B17_26680 [Candidatus Velthaea sp.]
MKTALEFGAVTPVVPARDVAASIAFYTEILGFDETFRDDEPPKYAGVARGAAEIHLFACDDHRIAEWTAFRIGVHDIEALFEHCLARNIVHPHGALARKPWGTREFTVVDPAGICITFWQRL